MAQSAVQIYDRIEIPKVEPDVTRVTLRGGVCPCCARRFKAPAPEGLEPGSPFGPNLRAFAPGLKSLLKRACALGRRRDGLADSTLKTYLGDLNRRLDRLLSLRPAHAAGRKLQETIKAIRGNLFVFMTNREIEATNNGSERALRPGAVYRKITNGFVRRSCGLRRS